MDHIDFPVNLGLGLPDVLKQQLFDMCFLFFFMGLKTAPYEWSKGKYGCMCSICRNCVKVCERNMIPWFGTQFMIF